MPSTEPRLIAQTEVVDDRRTLREIITADSPEMVWAQGDEGLLGWGEVARFDTLSMKEASAWWKELSSSYRAEDIPEEYGSGPVAFGSFVFDPENTSQTGVMLVPKNVISRRKGVTYRTTVALEKDPDRAWIRNGKDSSRFVENPTSAEQKVSQWIFAVNHALDAIHKGELEKVILAREIIIAVPHDLQNSSILTALLANEKSSWIFQVDRLLGATPEMLLKRSGAAVHSRVLAGTYAGGEQQSHDYFESSKSRREHELAVSSVVEKLMTRYPTGTSASQPFILELASLAHLATDVVATATDNQSALDLAAELHPTAAVCGTPRNAARSFIAAHENLDRGRYTGPVGWVDPRGNGEWGIALRCAEVLGTDERALRLFAGCGIVEESLPEDELQETADKFGPLLRALGDSRG